MRLGEGENYEAVKVRLLKAGYGLQEHVDNAKKQTGFSQAQSLNVKTPAQNKDAKACKVSNLRCASPEVFGNSSAQAARFNEGNSQDMNQGKKNKETELLAMSNWSRVGGKR